MLCFCRKACFAVPGICHFLQHHTKQLQNQHRNPNIPHESCSVVVGRTPPMDPLSKISDSLQHCTHVPTFSHHARGTLSGSAPDGMRDTHERQSCSAASVRRKYHMGSSAWVAAPGTRGCCWNLATHIPRAGFFFRDCGSFDTVVKYHNCHSDLLGNAMLLLLSPWNTRLRTDGITLRSCGAGPCPPPPSTRRPHGHQPSSLPPLQQLFSYSYSLSCTILPSRSLSALSCVRRATPPRVPDHSETRRFSEGAIL